MCSVRDFTDQSDKGTGAMPISVLMRSTPSLPVLGAASWSTPRGPRRPAPSVEAAHSRSRIIELVCQLDAGLRRWIGLASGQGLSAARPQPASLPGPSKEHDNAR